MGGVFVGLMAPQFFRGYYELPIALISCGALAIVVLRTFPEPEWLRKLLPPPVFLSGVVALALGGYLTYNQRAWFVNPAHDLARRLSKDWQPPAEFEQYVLMAALVVCAGVALALLRGDFKLGWARRPASWGALTAELLVLVLAGYIGYETREANSGNRVMLRNFYGGLKVRDTGTPLELSSVRGLTHGTINHGEQYLNIARRGLPTTYYGPNTGVGLAIRSKQGNGAIRVGVIGLGTGTLAAYGRLGDYYRFYEINPLVLRLAKTEFSFLPWAKAKTEVAMGDARLSLEREAPENFDVLAVDAFSSDAIPVHLLTKEAVQLYFRHLRPDGILAVHISNRYLDLAPVVEGASVALGKVARVVDTEDDISQNVFGATWALVTSPASGFDTSIMATSEAIKPERKVRLWTDDYSNLFQILK
ncbi:MAG: hypothetical protein EHM21_15905 [Chloroflexi bacterium]|nr:MAG: hypothetical protein EHM21_15905 [Chloroflexota bacterium]